MVGIEFEFRYFPSNLGFGLQTGFNTTNAKSEVETPRDLFGRGKYTSTYGFLVIPVVANLYYRIDFESSNNFVLLGGGAGYYFGRMKWNEKAKNSLGRVVYDEEVEGWQSKIGFQLLVEYDYVWDIGLTAFAGIKYSFVQFDKFGGEFGDVFDGIGFKAGLGFALYFGAGYLF